MARDVFILRAIRFDPAVASALLVTTLDVTGLVIYFEVGANLAWVVLWASPVVELAGELRLERPPAAKRGRVYMDYLSLAGKTTVM
jgi:hypothetical protein